MILAGFRRKSKPETSEQNDKGDASKGNSQLTLEQLRQTFSGVHDAVAQYVESDSVSIPIFYIRSLIDADQLQSKVIFPITFGPKNHKDHVIESDEMKQIGTLEEAVELALRGFAIVFLKNAQVLGANVASTLSRSIESTEQEAIVYGPKDSLSEQLEQNLTLIRRRLLTPDLKSRIFKVGNISNTRVAVLHIAGIVNPEFVNIAYEKTANIDFDAFFDSSHISAFLEDHINSVFPQFQQTDRPDAIAAALASGKVVWLIDNTPFALIAPITFFDLFQSPEDYIHRWTVGTFLRMLRFLAFIIALILAPVYVALTMHHYYSIPLDILYVLMESRSGIPFSPIWEAFFMLMTLEILKEASLRMPTKSGQTLGVVGGIVIGQAAVQAGIASNILIIHIAISAIASFLVPNYIMTNSSKLIQFALLFLAAWLGMWGIIFGLICLLIHLNSLTSLKQPYFAPFVPLYWKDWKDAFVRFPLTRMEHRPSYLRPLDRMRRKRRKQ